MTTSVELAGRLFATPDRLGWEYCEPLAPAPFLDEEPVWEGPPAPDVKAAERQKAAALRRATGRAVKGAIALLVASLVGTTAAIAVLCAVLAWVFVPIWWPSNQIRQAREQHRARQEASLARYREAHDRWQQQVSSHDRRESERIDTSTLWYPLHLPRHQARIDVFGGTGHGWASFVVTLGSSLLAGGHDITVLDLSDQQVGRELGDFARGQGTPVTEIELSGGRAGLLDGLDARGVAEVLAEAVGVVRRTSDDAGLRSLDLELVHTVVGRLEAPATFGRIVAGLQVLRRTYDFGDARLSDDEVAALTARIDAIGRTDRVQDELQFLTSTLDLLADGDGASSGDVAELLDGRGLAVLTTSDTKRRRKEMLDSIVFHRVLADLRERSGTLTGRVLVVAGADRLGLDGLEDLTGQARRLGLRLVLLFEHLRGELRDLVGGSGSTSVFMRLGNFQEAEIAAQQIGRGQKLVLSQLTRQVGETLTSGTSEAHGTQEGTSTTQTRGGGRSSDGILGSTSTNWSRAEGTHRSESWQTTTSASTAQSATDGVTLGRVHEFLVEPTQIQDLPHTAFVMVAPSGSGSGSASATAVGGPSRRIVLGDCNPGIVLLPRVATEPLQLPAG